ncbi:hypothetical protein DY000_02044331, partial [Brassica cretica]
MEKAKYKNVIQACSLKKDLELFSHGDQTIIGERGINLSGGQKQRVQLARALYQDADIYLLDDPFSALDAHTSSDLFRDYILSALAEKTVVFVTHQVEFLPAADLILVMKEGRVIQSGKYDDLLQAGTDFKALVSAHHEAIEAMDIPSPSSEDSDENPILDSLVMHHNSKSDIYENDIETLAKEVQDGGSASDQKAIKEKKKKAKRSRKKQLVQEEERVKGKISMKVYLSYMGAAYKGLLIPLIILAQASFQFLQIASNCRLGIIPQDPTLFEGTIRANLDPLEEHSDDKIWEALDKSQLGDVVRGKDLKLDSPVLENGDNWSVGQRQLVSLGRALLKQAKILVLDEATASVDTATDNLIQKIIRTEFEDCTVCTIAHRIPTVIDSDLVLVLSDGRVAEFDTPARLLEDKSSMFLKL